MKITITSVNKYVVSDKGLNILIPKKPRQRYRQIIRAYYKRIRKEN